MKDKELKQLAIDISEGKVYGTFHMNKCEISNMGSVFMPLMFMTDEQRQKMSDEKVVHLYEHIDKAGPRSINGMPIFMSFSRIVDKDWKKIVKYIREYKVKVTSFLNKEEKKEPAGPTLFEEE